MIAAFFMINKKTIFTFNNIGSTILKQLTLLKMCKSISFYILKKLLINVIE